MTSLKAAVVASVVSHARDAAPAECCGVLLGIGHTVVDAIRTRNIADRPTRFEIDPRDHIDALRAGRARGFDVVGFYHSHPHSAANPSESDLAEASYEGLVHLIVSLAADPPDIRLFRGLGGNFIEEPFVTVGE